MQSSGNATDNGTPLEPVQRRRFLKNSLSGVIQLLVNTSLLLVTIPLFMRILGTEGYGIFSLLSVLGNLSVLTTLGLNASLIKHLAEQGRCEESDYDVVVSFLVLVGLNLLVLAGGFSFSTEILSGILNVPAHLIDDVRVLYYLLLLSNALLVLGQVFSAILDAQEKIYLTNLVQFVYSSLYWGLLLGSLLIDPSYSILGWAAFAAACAWFAIIAYLALKTWGYPRPLGLMRDYKRVLQKHLRYGMQVYLSGLVGFFYEPLTKILISNFIGVAEVGYFDIALRIRNQMLALVGKLFYPLFPLIAKTRDEARVRLLVHDIEQKTFIVVLPLVVTLVFITTPVIELWIGYDVAMISFAVALISGAYLLFSITALPNYHYLLLKGHATNAVMIQLTNVVVNAAVFFFTYGWLGYHAAVIATVAAIVSSFALSVYFQKKYLESMVFDSLAMLMKALLVSVACLVVGWALSRLSMPPLATILIVPVSVGLVALLLYRQMNILRPEDIRRYFGSGNWLAEYGTRIFCKAETT